MTPFGKQVRQERKERGMSIGFMAEKLGVSTPYLSQLETGVKPATSRILDRIIELFDLNQGDAEALTRAAAHSQQQTVSSVTIDVRSDASERDRELATHLALSFNRLSPAAKGILRSVLENKTNG